MPPPQPLSKRKSCASCVKAKRKCGMELPRCARCMKKDIGCYYPNPRRPSTVDTTTNIPGLEFSWLDNLLFSDAQAHWSGQLQPQLMNATATVGTEVAMDAPSSTGYNTTTTANTSSDGSSRISGEDVEMLRGGEVPAMWNHTIDMQEQLSFSEGVAADNDVGPVLVPPLQSDDVAAPSSTTVAASAPAAKEPPYLQTTHDAPNPRTLSRSQTDAALHRFRTWPEKWVKEGKAPFIHPRLYSPSMPKSLQDAYAACAIYSVKTAQNEAIAFTVIESKANDVLRSRGGGGDDGNDKGAPWTPLDLLAAVQALIIFQFIRLFDGDIRQRAQAEEAQLVLQDWSDELEARTVLERAFTTDSAPSWRSWIFAESVRRTMVMSLNLAGVYSYLFHGFCTFGPRLKTYTFTAQRWLWEAKSELEWDRVKRSRASYYIKGLDFEHVLDVGQEDELDEFGVMMLVMVKGQDYFDDWIVSRRFTRPPIMDLNIGKSLADLVHVPSSGDVGSISVV